MAVLTELGLVDHGGPVTLKEFESADFEEGYKYEIIDGRLYVSPEAEMPEGRLESWLFNKLLAYSRLHPEVINYVYNKARVFIPRRRRTTVPEPDLAAYSNYPHSFRFDSGKWRDVSPVLVGEVLYAADPYKDLVRNVKLYLLVPSIREYWILDARHSGDEPTLIVYRRRGEKWVKREYHYRETYETNLLPGFKLRIDPRR